MLDTCTVLSLYATYRIPQIASVLGAKLTITEYVLVEEVKYIFDDHQARVTVDLTPHIKSGDLLIVNPTELEMETAVDFMSDENEDGESFTGAVAFHRNWAIATDEKKALKYFQKHAPNNQLFTTLDIVKYWADISALPPSEVSKVLRDIRVRRGYMISPTHHLLGWWSSNT